MSQFIATKRTTSIYNKHLPQLQVMDTKIYYVWYESDGYNTQIWTAEMNTDGTGWSATKRTTTAYDKSDPQLQVVGTKIYYVWDEWDGYRRQIWTAEMNTDGTGWSATQRTTTAYDKGDPQLQVVGTKIYYVWGWYDGSITQIVTAEMNTDGTGWSATQRTSSFYNKAQPQLQVVGTKIYYVWDEWDGYRRQIWTAEMNTDGTGWSATQRTTTTGSYGNVEPQLQVVGTKIYYVWRSTWGNVITAEMNTDGTGFTTIEHTLGYIKYLPQLQVMDTKIYYVWYESDGYNTQIWTAEMNTDGTGWSATKRTTTAYYKSGPKLNRTGNIIRYIYTESDGSYYQIWTAELIQSAEDTGSGAENILIDLSTDISDIGTEIESVTVASALNLQDLGASIETVAPLSGDLPITDLGSGSEVSPITIQPDAAAGKDSYIDGLNVQMNFGTNAQIRIGKYNTNQPLRGILQFDVSSITPGTLIDKASLSLYCNNVLNSNPYTFNIYRVVEAWWENQVNWNNQPDYSTLEGSTQVSSAGTWYEWDITNLIRGWVNGTIANNGLIIVVSDESIANTVKEFLSSDYYFVAEYRPKLVVNVSGVDIQSTLSIPDTGSGSDSPSITSNTSISDSGAGTDSPIISGTLSITDSVSGSESPSINGSMSISDSGSGADSPSINVSLSVSDNGAGSEVWQIVLSVSDSGVGTENISSLLVTTSISDSGAGIEGPINVLNIYFYVDENGILNPLNVKVLRDSRKDLLPGIEYFTEEIPGKHGDIKLGYRWHGRILELVVASNEEFNISQREQIKRDLAKYLESLDGAKVLGFADDQDKLYYVKYSSQIDLNQYPSWLHFTIPFKSSSPYSFGLFEKSKTGSCTLSNGGNVETPLRIEIAGPVTNPSVIVGSHTLTYIRTVNNGQLLIIDTEKLIVELDGVNVLANYSGGFPKLQPGDTNVTAASAGITTWRWRERWVS